MASRSAQDSAAEYSVRQFTPDDSSGLQALYRAVRDERPSERWIRWRFQDPPVDEDIPMFIAATDQGTIVAARPVVPFRVHTGKAVEIGIQPTTAMVHPAHRRQGVFRQLTAISTDEYLNRAPAFYFSFPTEAEIQGARDFGYRIVGELPTYYRVQDPEAVVDALAISDRFRRVFSTGSRLVTRSYLGVRDRLVGRPTDLRITRYVDPPVDVLETLGGQHVPDGLHAARTAAFYRWRLDEPGRSFTTYLAERNGVPVGSIVCADGTDGGLHVVRIMDVLPLVESGRRTEVVLALFAQLLDDARSADLVVAQGQPFPHGAMSTLGFFADTRPPLSQVTAPTMLAVYSLQAAGDWSLQHLALDERRDWCLTRLERLTT